MSMGTSSCCVGGGGGWEVATASLLIRATIAEEGARNTGFGGPCAASDFSNMLFMFATLPDSMMTLAGLSLF